MADKKKVVIKPRLPLEKRIGFSPSVGRSVAKRQARRRKAVRTSNSPTKGAQTQRSM